MSDAKMGGQLRRALGYGVVVSVLLAGALFVFNMVIDNVISTVETVVVPCQHGGLWSGNKCDCIGPWTGQTCGDCACVHGQCDQLHISAPFANSLWGCRCPDNWLGAYCDLCTSERDDEGNCNGDCLEGYTGSKCETRCVADADFPAIVENIGDKYTEEVDLWIAGGNLNACSGHGVCENSTNVCLCEEFYFPSADGKSDCKRTCWADPNTGALCYGHGVCTETNNNVHCVCQEGYHLKSDCSLACPGMDIEWMKESCSGRGVCSLEGEKAVCDCTSEVYIGDACQYKCPTNEDGDSGVPCNGHGVCALTTGPFVQPKCTCAEGWKGPSCECNDAQTCSGHGTCTDTGVCECDPLFRGKRCNTCVERRYGSQCALQCDERKATDESTPVDDIGCNSRGVCVVSDFARATESVMCACSRNFDFETHCKECKRFHYPKIGASGLADPEEDAAVACQAFANRATCNQAGEPKLGFSSDASPGAPCLCDQPYVDGNSFCTKCKETFFPDGGDMSSPSACSKRCVDSEDHPAWMEGVFTLVCKNQGVCDPTGELCVCPDGYSGKDCSIACGGDTPCSGHGRCVSNILEQFLSAEVKNSIAGGASHHCQCDPQPPIDDREKLLVFTGLEDISGSNTETSLEYMGDFCEYSCLRPGWLDSLPCNGETCTALPILDNQGSAVLSGCTQDTDCGDWDAENGRLVFLDGNGDEIPTSSLSAEQVELRGQISLQNRWSPRMGPFCKVPTLPLALHTSNMVCTQRVNEEGRTEATEALCETKKTKFGCLSESGNCKWTDSCLEGLEKFDEFSYCYELMRTERPGALRSENCTSSCDSDSLSELDWAGVCDHFTARVPAQFQSCSSNLDDLCEESADATSKVQSCAGTLSPGAKNMRALDAASLCWELSDEQDAFDSPLAFEPLLDTETARDLQARFDPALRDLGMKHECAVQTRDVQSSCAQMRSYNSLMLFDTPAPFLYSCEIDGQATLGDTDLAGNDIFCGVKTTVQELSPFVLQCESGTVALKGVTAVEAVEESLRTGCHLLAKSDLHGSGIFVGEKDAADMCRKVLESENPNACERVCGSDSCTNVGTSRAGVQIFQCERDDPSTVSEESCLLGTFSLTGGEGGGQYRCAVAGDLLKPESPASFLPCEGSLIMHADRLGFGDAKTSGLDGTRSVVDETVHASSATQTIRVEFDVEIVSASRGAVNVLGKKTDDSETVLASVLLRHFGGLGWDLNGQTEDDEPCAAGEGDSCKTKVDVGAPTHVILEINASHVAATFGDDKAVKPISQDGDFDGVSVTGSARVKQLFVVGGNTTEKCARLHRKTGRAATWRQSLEAASAAPPTTLGYCANMEKAWATESCDTGTPAEWDAVFDAPWEEYCAYGDHLSHFLASSQSECATNGISRQSVVDCAPVLSTFSTVECARDAMTFDWENDYCAPLRNDTSPDVLTEIGCDSQCLSEVKQSDLSAFCADRTDYWVGNEARPRFPSGCAATDAANDAWKSQDWRAWCLAKASNTAEGVCSAATCDCSSNGGFMGGDACELSCNLGSDGSVCNEASFSGVCDYPDTFEAKVDDYYADATKLVLKKRASEFQGVCKCANSRALAKDGCDVSCDSDDGEPVCNTRTYSEYDETWEISACHAGGTGVCACLPPLTRQVQENISDWRGNKATVLSFEYGGLPATAPWDEQFRVRAAQGPESLMIRLFNYSQSTWRTARHKFEEQPALFPCGDRPCDFSDVVLAQSLYTTSSFFGPTCSRRCPSVDTGESLVKYEGTCDFADPVRADRLTLEACQNECLDEWRCNFVRFNNITSDCRLYESCVPSSASGEDDVFWYERKLTSTPEMTPCSGRGACTMTGTCVCDSAKFLSLTDPITGKRMRVQADERSSLAEVPTTSLDTTGYRGDDCSLMCPGFDPEVSDISTVCSGHGICTRSAVCQCSPGFTGQNCEYPCPSMDSAEDTTTTCSGHGTCSESRMIPTQSSVEKEDVQQQYALTEAWRNWINACEENQEVSFLVLPFGNYPGMLDQATIKGGINCEPVPQQIVDDIKDKFTDRPVIEVLAIRDFVELDAERDLDAESMEVEGRSDDQNHDRVGVFRRRYWNESNTWQSQNVFVAGYEEVQVEDGSIYEKFPGFRCDGEQIGSRETGLATAGECALRCEDLEECACFDYQEHYHSAFLGGCRLTKAGLLHSFPIHTALQIGAENGLMEKHQDGDLTAFEEFTETYVVLQSDKSCRTTTVNIGDNVASVEDCAQVCANRYDDGCRYFTWSSDVRRCSEVKTSSSACDEGFNTDPSGFYAVSVENQGATAPTAYHVSGSARLFPKDKPRGTVSGSYYGRARAEWVIGVAQCSCSKSYGFGHWSGFACQSCEKFWGGESCTKQCPGVLAGEPCFSNGVCLWGSKDGLGVPGTFYDATCLCGDPAAPKSTDLSLTGTWSVESFDLHVEATFQRLSAQTEFFEDPNNYGFRDSTCRGCVEKRGGRNCASQCSWCLFSGSCQFSVSNSISVPCLCTSNYYDSENGCAPHGFVLNNANIAYDVGGLSETNRARRLEALPGLDVTVGAFYDDAVYPSVQTSLFPSRRFTSPCPNVHETNWMLDLSETPSRACKRLGNCRNRGARKMIVNGIPPRYFPLSCLELNSGGVAEDTAWESASRELFFTYDEKFLLDASNPSASEGYYGGNGTYASFSLSQLNPSGRDFSLEDFFSTCRQSCADQPNCVGAVVKRIYGTKEAHCYLSQNTFIASPSQEFISTEPNALFTTYRIKREYDFCRLSDPRNVAVLVKENAACSTDKEQILGARLPSSDPLYDPDAAQECANRCVALHPTYNSFWVNPSGACYCNEQCTQADLTNWNGANSYQITRPDYRWCSLGSVTYGEIELCADVALTKQNEDATTDSGLSGIDITMGNLGARCEVDVSPDGEDPQWEARAGSGCAGVNETKIRLHDATSVMLDYANGANALVFGAYKTGEFEASVAKVAQNSFGEMRPENPCNGKAGYFWSITDKTKCEHAETRQTCDIHDWRVCPEAQFSSDTDLHSVHDLRAMYPHRLAVGGSELEVTVVELDFTFNLQPIDSSDIQKKIDDEQQKIDDANGQIQTFQGNINSLTNTYNSYYAKAIDSYAVWQDYENNKYPTCSDEKTGTGTLYCAVLWWEEPCGTYDIYEYKCYEKTEAKEKRLLYESDRNTRNTAKSLLDYAKKSLSDENTKKTNAQALKAKYEKDKEDMIAGETCTTDRKCDLCQGNCDDDSECREGLVCLSSILSPRATHYCGGSAPSSNNYCMPPMHADESNEPYLVGYAAHAGSYTTKIVEVNPSTGYILVQYGESHNDLSISDAAPDDSSALHSKRSEPRLARDATTLAGYIFRTGVAGNVPREGKALSIINEPRGFPVADREECKQLCEQTAGCTAVSVVKSTVDNGNFRTNNGAYCSCEAPLIPYSKDTSLSASQAVEKCRSACVNDDSFWSSFWIGVEDNFMDACRCFKYTHENCPCSGGVTQLVGVNWVNFKVYDRYLDLAPAQSKPFKCMLHTLSVPQDVQCSSLENDVFYTDVMLLKPERCGLCKAMGMSPDLLEDDSAAQVRCSRQNKLDEYCEVFPTKNAEDVYSWSEKRCPPVRPGFEKMHTSIVRVGESFKLDELSPYETISGHPDVQSFSHCESMCVSETKCVAWHFTDVLTAERGDDAVTHVCELYSYVPPMISTASERENVFSGRTRIGTVQRDFSQVEIFMDDGDFASCDCNDDAESGGYDCGCKKTSSAPYKPYELHDETWGCSNKGVCGGTGYFCVCDDGYEWAWGPEDTFQNIPAGYTCRACAAGTYKNSDVKHCTSCPLGTYQDQTGQAQCTACGEQTPTTSTTGAESSDACLTCPSGRILGSLAEKTHTDFLNLNYDDNAVLCVPCGVGKFDTGFGDAAASTTRTCQDCPPGKTTSTYGMSACDVTTISGDCDEPGMAWEHPDDVDPEILGGALCVMCPMGRFADDATSTCVSCPKGKSTGAIGKLVCDDCPRGYVAPLEAQMGCDACVPGKYTEQTSQEYCKDCPGGYFAEDAAWECPACPRGFVGTVTKSECDACVPGKYIEQTAQESCKLCPQGRYMQDEGHPGNQDVVGGIQNLKIFGTSIPALYDGNTLPCTYCDVAKYNSEEGSSSESACKDCESGKYNLFYGSTSCSSCPPGRQSFEFSTRPFIQNLGRVGCECKPGYFNGHSMISLADINGDGVWPTGAYGNTTHRLGYDESCKACPTGYTQGPVHPHSVDGSDYCTPCPAGKFTASSGGLQCFDCEAGKFALPTRRSTTFPMGNPVFNTNVDKFSDGGEFVDKVNSIGWQWKTCEQVDSANAPSDDIKTSLAAFDKQLAGYEDYYPFRQPTAGHQHWRILKGYCPEMYQFKEDYTGKDIDDCKQACLDYKTPGYEGDGTWCYFFSFHDPDGGTPYCIIDKYYERSTERENCKLSDSERIIATYSEEERWFTHWMVNDADSSYRVDPYTESCATTDDISCAGAFYSEYDWDVPEVMTWHTAWMNKTRMSCGIHDDIIKMDRYRRGFKRYDQTTRCWDENDCRDACKLPSSSVAYQKKMIQKILNPDHPNFDWYMEESGAVRSAKEEDRWGETRSASSSYLQGGAHSPSHRWVVRFNPLFFEVGDKAYQHGNPMSYRWDYEKQRCECFAYTHKDCLDNPDMYVIQDAFTDTGGSGAVQFSYRRAFTQTSCTTCAADRYQDESGQSSCKLCPPGKQIKNISGLLKECDECPAGKFKATEEDVSCETCALGQFQEETGTSSCKNCPAGQFQQQSTARDGKGCTNCPPHFFQDEEGAEHSGSYPNTVMGCKLCDANLGQFQDEYGQSGCKLCEDGKTKNALETTEVSGNALWDLFEDGWFWTFSGCTECAEGKYRAGTMVDCVQCIGNANRGEFYGWPSKDHSECVYCRAGMYGDSITACKQCPEGWYNDNKNGATGCKTCPEGYHDVFNIVCEKCEATGVFYDSSVFTMGIVPDYEFEGDGRCKEWKGINSEYGLSSGMSWTTRDECAYLCYNDPDCTMFSYREGSEASTGLGDSRCQFPAAGFDCAGAAKKYFDQGYKTYSIVGPRSYPTYKLIAPNKRCSAFTRPPGPEWGGYALFLDPSDPMADTDRAQECANRCEADGRNYFFLHKGWGGRCMCGKDSCKSSHTVWTGVVDTYAIQNHVHTIAPWISQSFGGTVFDQNPNADPPAADAYDTVGELMCSSCPEGRYQDQSQHSLSECKGCLAGTYGDLTGQDSSSDCKSCPAHAYSDEEGLTVCKECPRGFQRSESTDARQCDPCPSGTGSRNEGIWQEGDPKTCELCPAGRVSQAINVGEPNGYGKVCSTCGTGVYQNEVGQQSCKSCPDGYYQTQQEQTGCTIAPAGRYVAVSDTNPYPCPAGTYQDSQGANSPAGSVSHGCKDCPTGYESEAESIECTACPAGKVVGLQGDCEICAAGTFQDESAAKWIYSPEHLDDIPWEDVMCVDSSSTDLCSWTGTPLPYSPWVTFENAVVDARCVLNTKDCRCENRLVTKPLNGPHGDYHNDAHLWYFDDAGGRHGDDTYGAKQNNIPECMGDCDSDDQCADGLVCHQRNAADCQHCAIPVADPSGRCVGSVAWNDAADFCVQPVITDVDKCKERCIKTEGCTSISYGQGYHGESDQCWLFGHACDYFAGAPSSSKVEVDDTNSDWKSYKIDIENIEYKCKSCPDGYYQSDTESSSCTSCPAGWGTDSLGATSCVDKRCKPGYKEVEGWFADTTSYTEHNSVCHNYVMPQPWQEDYKSTAFFPYLDSGNSFHSLNHNEYLIQQSTDAQLPIEDTNHPLYDTDKTKECMKRCLYDNAVQFAPYDDDQLYINLGGWETNIYLQHEMEVAGDKYFIIFNDGYPNADRCLCVDWNTENPHGRQYVDNCDVNGGKLSHHLDDVTTYKITHTGSKTKACVGCGTAGTYQDLSEQTTCKFCPEGQYTLFDSPATSCTLCPAGWFSEPSWDTYPPPEGFGFRRDYRRFWCEPCDDGTGKYQDEAGQSSCKTCPAGKAGNACTDDMQYPCGTGYYDPRMGSTACV